MERIRELMQDQWLPELKELNNEYTDVLEKKRANSQGSSRTKQARQDEANKQLASIDERCKHLQGLYFECLVKIIRAQPVRARMLLTNVLYNCHAGLSPTEARDKAETVTPRPTSCPGPIWPTLPAQHASRRVCVDRTASRITLQGPGLSVRVCGPGPP